MDTLFVNIAQAFDGLPYGIQPYVGVGLGYVDVDSSLSYAPGATIDDDDNVFGYQFMIGSSLILNDNFDLFVEYRRTYADDLELDRRVEDQAVLRLLNKKQITKVMHSWQEFDLSFDKDQLEDEHRDDVQGCTSVAADRDVDSDDMNMSCNKYVVSD